MYNLKYDDYGIKIIPSDARGYSCKCVTSPFGNCQSMSIKNFQNLLINEGVDRLGNPKLMSEKVLESKRFKNLMPRLAGTKRGLMIDVYEDYRPILEIVFRGCIKFRKSYRNFTGSKMIIMYIDLLKFSRKINKKSKTQ